MRDFPRLNWHKRLRQWDDKEVNDFTEVHVPIPTSEPTDGYDPEEGATTVEYAIGTIAAAGFAGLLIVILKSDTVRAALESIIQEALSTR